MQSPMPWAFNMNSEIFTNPFLCLDWTQPCFLEEFLVGLSFHQIVSPLKALGSIWDVTVGSWASGDG